MAAEAQPFQVATAEVAYKVLRRGRGSRRFLVADEPGLGKTVVARTIIERLVEWQHQNQPRRPLVVYYITSDLHIAHQNCDRLVAGLRQHTPHELVSRADRLGLIPLTARLRGPAELFALTPGTSFPSETKSRGPGRARERAFLFALLERTVPDSISSANEPMFRRGLSAARWNEERCQVAGEVAGLPRSFVRTFHFCLKQQFGTRFDLMLPFGKSQGRVLARLRRVLSHAALLSHPPDLVILDEFQKYRHLIATKMDQDELVAAMFNGTGDARPAVLLLSGTPYPSKGENARKELFELLAFLKNDKRFSDELVQAFENFEAILRDIAKAAGNHQEQALLATRARQVRALIQGKMQQVMARTERESLAPRTTLDHTTPCKVGLEVADLEVFRGLTDLFRPSDHHYAQPYWSSVPLPGQALGRRYEAWKRRLKRPLTGPHITAATIAKLKKPGSWPHPKLRALEGVAPVKQLALPWVPPSLAWWDLGGAWKDVKSPQKLLLFSRFKAAPQSIAALTSYGVDSAVLKSGPGAYDAAGRSTRLKPGKKQMPLLALFHPSPFLIRVTDPLAGNSKGNLRSIRALVRRQLKSALAADRPIMIDEHNRKAQRKRRPVWQVLAGIEKRRGLTSEIRQGWDAIADQESSVAAMLAAWREVKEVDAISPRELNDLVELALSAPGVICGRALLRHHHSALDGREYAALVDLCWTGLRVYLDEPVFWAVWGKGKSNDTLRKAMLDGCFESVLDEHFWMRRGTVNGGARGLAKDLARTFRLSTGGFTFQVLGRNGEAARRGLRLRCHAAVPFGGAEKAPRQAKIGAVAQRQSARGDDLRTAFNTPFWPHLLASTSVGQEGLDFHTWCARVMHWDLCPGPVELEQREGRVSRYAGLSVRRELAQRLRHEALNYADGMHQSPWDRLADLATERYRDASGLQPWWQLDGASVQRYVFQVPLGRDTQRYELLQKERMVYRLALGQPNAEDLVRTLAVQDSATIELLRGLVLDLCAFKRAGPPAGGAPVIPLPASPRCDPDRLQEPPDPLGESA